MERETNMTFEDMYEFLSQSYTIKEIKDINFGKQIKMDDCVVNVYTTGKYQVQGKNKDEVLALIESGEIKSNKRHKSKKIFVVYGHDDSARTELESILRRWGLEPVILDKIASGGKTVIEKLESQIPSVEYGIVLATPDDEGYRREAPDEKMYRCRQNVVLEMGMLLARLGRDNIAVLLKDPKNIERPSDIQGIVYIPFENKIEPEASKVLAREIENKLGVVIPASVL